MKKTLLIGIALISCITSFAQRTEYKFKDTEARKVNVLSNAYVKPLTCEVKVETDNSITDNVTYTREEVENAMKGNLDNIRANAVYQVCQKHKCDMIVAAISTVESTNDGYVVKVTGYPANFVNWKTASQADLEWIRMEKTLTTADREKIAGAVKTDR